VLLVLLESSLDPVAIWVSSHTLAVGLAVFEFAVVVGAVGPGHLASAVHVVLLESTLVDFAGLGKVVLTFSVELAVNEIAFINVTVKFKFTFACLLSIDEVSSVNDLVVVPLLSSFSVILIIFPLTLIHRSLLIDKNTFSGGFTVFPLTLVNITI